MHTILIAPLFEDRQPQRDATIWRVSLTASLAFKLICDIGHLYPSHEYRPRVGAMLEEDGALTLYVWPRVEPDSRLLLLMLNYSGTRKADASHWEGQAWLTGDLLAKVLAVLAHRDHWRMTTAPRLADELPGYLLGLPRQTTPYP